MCGLAGIISEIPIAAGREISEMTSRLAHRGPDGWGYAAIAADGRKPSLVYSGDPPDIEAMAHLGHRRLSIIDIEGSRQPLCNEDGTVWVVFNGEIYNYIELTSMLERRGHKFSSKGDTEVLTHLWEDFGEGMLEYLRGMFAFAIWDSKKALCFLARDRFGKKPLYYAERNGRFHFASELQALAGLERFKPLVPDQTAMAQYFRYGFIPGPRTAYKDIFCLEAGHFMIWQGARSRLQRYWKPTVCGEIRKPDMDELLSLLDDSVRLRMRSDAPLGAFLSGGIDSAMVVSSMALQTSGRVKTFTVCVGSKHWQDESGAARKTALHLNTDHTELNIEADFLPTAFGLAQYYGQPFADHSSIAVYHLCRQARKQIKVAVTGDGGDELFAGYNGYLRLNFYRLVGSLPFSLRRSAAKMLHTIMPSPRRRDYADALLAASPLPQKGENISPLFHRVWRQDVFEDEFKKHVEDSASEDLEVFSSFYREAPSSDPLDKWLEADQRLYLAYDILCKLDIASMSVSLECRSPLLDHKFAEYANRISSNAKIANGTTKAPLRALALRRLPREISSLPKKGFSLPLAQWMRHELKSRFEDIIFGAKDSWKAYLKEDAVRRLWAEHISGRADHHMRLWMVSTLAILAENNPCRQWKK